MPRYRKYIWAGDVYECEEHYSPRAIEKKYNRGQNEILTSEEQKERNLKIARRKLSRLINANFKQGDLFITLTYRRRLTREEIKRELRNFLSRLRRWRKKRGLAEDEMLEMEAELLDIIAVGKTVKQLLFYQKKAAELVYFTDADKELKKGDISERVHKA